MVGSFQGATAGTPPPRRTALERIHPGIVAHAPDGMRFFTQPLQGPQGLRTKQGRGTPV